MKKRNIGDTATSKRENLLGKIVRIDKDFNGETLYTLENGSRYLESELKPEPASDDYLESRDFVDLMQCYRLAPETNQERVIDRFESVKQFIREKSIDPVLLQLLKQIESHLLGITGIDNTRSLQSPLQLLKFTQSAIKRATS